MRRRRHIVFGWLLAGGASVLLAAVFLVGCCVLPFHDLTHRLLPLCDVAAAVLALGNEAGHEHPAVPAERQDGPRKQRDASSVAASCPGTTITLAVASVQSLATPTGDRAQISPGALRCDDDVGQRLALLETLRI